MTNNHDQHSQQHQEGEFQTQPQPPSGDPSPSQQQQQQRSQDEEHQAQFQEHSQQQQHEHEQTQEEQQQGAQLQHVEVQLPAQQQQQQQDHQQPQQLDYPQQQQQQHQHPQQSATVLVVQQPIILGRGAYIRRGQPFMYRGVQLGNGRKIGMNCMITFGLVGGMLIISGAIYGIDTLHGFICASAGAMLIGSSLRLCHKAKEDYDSLPQDHPDRVTYSSPIVLSREAREIASNTTTYQLPPGAQIISSSPLQAGQMAPAYQLPVGAQVISSTSSFDSRVAHSAFLQQAVAASSDKPPPYEEVCKTVQN